MRRMVMLGLITLGVGGCDWMPGKPKPEQRWQPASAVLDFKKLRTENCQGCHGSNGHIAGSITMDDPLYLAVIPRDTLRQIIAKGVPHTKMPAFAQSQGGLLDDRQIDILADGIMANAKVPAGVALPPYSAPLGNPQSGASAFAASCAGCHGADGAGGSAGSVINPAYLGLVGDQYLRTIIIAGRRDLGCPDFLNRIPGRPMSNEEIADITAWLISHRKDAFGKPLAPSPH